MSAQPLVAIDASPVTCSIEQAAWYASWFTRYLLDTLDGTEHPGIRGHTVAARTQHAAICRLLGVSTDGGPHARA